MTTATTSTQILLDAAEEAQRAATAIAAEPSCAPRSAAGPLIAATQALARATQPGRSALAEEPGGWLAKKVWAGLSAGERAQQQAQLRVLLAEARRAAEVPGAFALTRAQVLMHAARLGRMISASRGRLGGRAPGRGRVWLRRGLVVGGAAILAVLFVRPWQSPSFGPWRGSYYSRHDFKGEIVVRHDLDLRFDWGKSPPFDEVPANKYSVRWDVCLTVPEAGRASFQLTTDNNAQLFINDRLVISNWDTKALRARGATRPLSAGVHHLRVDYQKLNRESHVGLTASLDGEPPRALPFSRLSAPRVDEDGVAVCD